MRASFPLIASGRRRTSAILAATALSAAALTGCSADGAEKDGVTTIKYQSAPGAVDPLLLADALGYLDGVELELTGTVNGGPQSIQALMSKQVDITSAAFLGAVTQSVASGADIKAVVPVAGANEKMYQSVYVAPGSGIEGPEDLVGKKVAVNGLGTNAEAFLDAWFEAEGLDEDQQDDITLVPLPLVNVPQAVQEGQVDAAVIPLAIAQLFADSSDAVELVRDTEVLGNYAGNVMAVRGETIAEHPEALETVVSGITRAITFVETHDKQEVFDAFFPWLEEHDRKGDIETAEAMFLGTFGLEDVNVLEDRDIERWLPWLEKRGDVDTGSISPADIFTNEFNPDAAEAQR